MPQEEKQKKQQETEQQMSIDQFLLTTEHINHLYLHILMLKFTET